MIDFDQVHNKHICPICEQQCMFQCKIYSAYSNIVYSHCMNHKFKTTIKSIFYHIESQINSISIEFKILSFGCIVNLYVKPLKLIIFNTNYNYHKEYMIYDLNSVQDDAELYLLYD